MILESSSCRRLVIYFFYDGMGIVDDYNIYMLKDMMKNCSDLFVVSNGAIGEEGKSKFQDLDAQIFERKNKGFDVGAYKDAILELGWDKLETYDEVIFMNYTIMGPFYPFSEMFESMDQRNLDFWGITKFHEVQADPYGIIKCGYLREHIQSHFIAVRRDMVRSADFHEYWEKMPKIKSYGESVAFHESYFTYHFSSRSYTWEVYADSDDLREITDFPLLKVPVRMLRDKRCPIIKRRSFMHDYDDFLNTTVGEPSYELMEYIKTQTNYDVNLIWDNILRCCNQALIKECLQLNYILPSNTSRDMSAVLKEKKVALVMHLYFPELLDESYKYASSMPKEADIYVTTHSDEMKRKIEEKFKNLQCHKFQIVPIQNRGRDVSALLVGVKDIVQEYDYVCFAHDKKVTQLEPLSKGASWSYQCYENTLKNSHYVRNIIDLFENNPRLGLLTPPPPCHAEYFPTLGMEWAGNAKNVMKLANELDLHVPISKSLPPIAPLGSIFWFRPKAMKKIYSHNWTYEDFPQEPLKNDGSISHAIERIHSFVVQDAGYYPAWGFSDSYAAIQMTNLTHMLRDINLAVMKGGVGGAFIQVKNELVKRAPIMSGLDEISRLIVKSYPHTADKKCDDVMRLYYDTGEGYSEKTCIIQRAAMRKKNFSVEFDIPSGEEIKNIFRFDPGEQGTILIKNAVIMLNYKDGTNLILELKDCESNGFEFNNKILFLITDPQIYFAGASGKKLQSILISGKITNRISDDVIQKAISRRIPKMTPKLYFDSGKGICEENSLRVANQGDSKNLNVVFELEHIGKTIKKLRFDPCEEGLFVWKNCQIKVYSAEGKTWQVDLGECVLNGYLDGKSIIFLEEDPQIVWDVSKYGKINRIEISGELSEDISSAKLGEFLKKNKITMLAKKYMK